ncbi:chitin-binding protein [Streptosporangium becharense]|uniref:Chitin-binding protein n=1 Tax=Streptosporangium becharense TaxID=1816182 RepID=A0A7W9MHY4_9ACTN|nr:lytic polysaccharide monooxygenase [Streptosporangium becharense]MBB2911335.1 chitin-binding protein [Streptosporangium becharense]MBB5821607.1 chitin-binding protein [Streptosporangium becharense]
MHKRHRAAAVGAAAITAGSVLALLPSAPAVAHGSMSNPPSRAYVCKSEGPETPKSAACKAAIAAGGTQAFYDWHEVSRLEAGGNHRAIIPDGQLCGAGREKYRGLNLTRTDWPATRVSPGALTITYHATAPHANSNFEFYITRAGYDPSQPLRWSDLEHIRTFTNQNPTTFTNWTINLPQRSGRHILYSIWQRVVGSTEAFYTCSDVDFGGGNNPGPSPTPTVTPTQNPTQSPTPTVTPTQPSGTWAANTAYQVGALVTYGGVTYRCRQAHTSLPGWEPPAVAALWEAV